MKRKTNLFYTSGPDSKFLTFSNYTEALTGNFLSINAKLFPDRFLCLKINGLNISTKANFIKYLVAYYENKLAVLRDNSVSKNDTIEHNMYPLGYLLEAILKVIKYDKNLEEFYFDNVLTCDLLAQSYAEEPKIECNDYDKIKNLISYIGDVTEYDYNGTYTDIICNINMSSYNEGIIKVDNSTNNIVNTCTLDNSMTRNLYGWENEPTLFYDYLNVRPIFDTGKNTYSYNTQISRIEIKNIDTISKDYEKNLKFNIIIPLYSFCNIDKDTNNNILDQKFDIEEEVSYYDVNSSLNAVFDVPLGIWIHADSETDTFIELEKDYNLNTYPSWSLLISSQFKPFPYSMEIQKENATAESILNGFSTFSEILTKMANAIDNFIEMNQNIVSLSNRINSIESKLKEINTDTNISKINKDILSIRTELKENIEDLKQRIVNIRWSHA